MSAFQRGANLIVSMELFAENRQRLCAALRQSEKVAPRSFVVLQGGSETNNYDADTQPVFRQEPYFHWTFGVTEPDFYGIIDVDQNRATLFMAKLPEEYAIWLGKIPTLDEIKHKYQVDAVHYTDEIVSILDKSKASTLLLLKGTNTDSGLQTKEATFDSISKFSTDLKILHPVIAQCRCFKSDKELEVIRYACKVSVDAHKQVMRIVRPGLHQYQLESTFLHHSYYEGGCRHCGYTCICATGDKAAVLHYGHAAEPNDKLIGDGHLCLLDMGAEYCRYTADITITVPANGRFTPDQKLIYNAVYAANQAVFNVAKPGVSWLDMHKLAEREILKALRDGGLLVGDVEEMMAARLGAVFMPHGLGHFMGVDVHDPNGYPEGSERPKEPGLKSLRTTAILQPRMVITIEPGCYFINHLLNAALADAVQSKFLVKQVVERFRGFGGVRIEDDVLITESGCENLSNNLPRTVEEIEVFMAKENKYIGWHSETQVNGKVA